jgi:hypothetical protein
VNNPHKHTRTTKRAELPGTNHGRPLNRVTKRGSKRSKRG